MRKGDRRPTVSGTILAVLLLVTPGLGQTTDEPGSGAAPRDVGLVEHAERGLAQIDLTLTGPAERLAEITADDIELIVGNRFIERFTLDRTCPEPRATGAEPVEPAPALETAAPARAPATFLFYFDQHHLTQIGRVNALDMAREMIPELIRDGNRGIVVSSGKELKTFVDLTDDPRALLAGVDRVDKDALQWVTYPWEEDRRIEEVIEARDTNSTQWGCSVARRYQREEAFNTEKALRLFAMTLGHLADVDPPKAAVYFADTMRRDAGRHYVGYIGERVCNLNNDSAASLSLFDAQHALDNVIEQAAAYGTRLYTVQPEGLQTQTIRTPGLSQDSNWTANTQRFASAKDTLVGLSLETGGKAFINGVATDKMIERIEDDLSCPFLISFDTEGLPRDAPLAVQVRVGIKGIEAQARGQIVLQSEGKRVTSRLLAAFAAPKSVRTDVTAHGVVVPTGFADGKYTALVQIALPASPLPDAVWDVGASLISRGEFREDSSQRIRVGRPGVPVVYEQSMTFRPGPFEIIGVAHETTTGELATVRVAGEFPERGESAALGPVAMLQPEEALFVQDGDVRTSGARALDSDELIRTELPAALVGLVCRGRGKGRSLRVERSLVGESEVSFPDFDLKFDDEPCVVIQDVVPAEIMTPGSFRYRVRLLDGDEEIDSVEHRFAAADATVRAEAARGG